MIVAPKKDAATNFFPFNKYSWVYFKHEKGKRRINLLDGIGHTKFVSFSYKKEAFRSLFFVRSLQPWDGLNIRPTYIRNLWIDIHHKNTKKKKKEEKNEFLGK